MCERGWAAAWVVHRLSLPTLFHRQGRRRCAAPHVTDVVLGPNALHVAWRCGASGRGGARSARTHPSFLLRRVLEESNLEIARRYRSACAAKNHTWAETGERERERAAESMCALCGVRPTVYSILGGIGGLGVYAVLYEYVSSDVLPPIYCVHTDVRL